MGTRHHRLPRECYRGRVSAAFTLCLMERRPFFTEPSLVGVFVDFLKEGAEKHLFVAIYCFMPDHAHLVCIGRNDNTDLLRGVEHFKQASGYWLAKQHPNTKWQKSFHDRVIRTPELGTKVRYVLNNPVRRGLVTDWRQYPFTAAVGVDLEAFLEELPPD